MIKDVTNKPAETHQLIDLYNHSAPIYLTPTMGHMTDPDIFDVYRKFHTCRADKSK